MKLKYLEKLFVFSAIFAGIFLYVLSCENPNNPFASNLGAKVDVEPPTVFDITPISGKFLKGTQEFKGSANAYRALHSERGVEVRIFSPVNEKEFMTGGGDGWTTDGIVITGGDDKEKTFSFSLNTLDTSKYRYNVYNSAGVLTGTKNGMEDGFLKIQFRANDSSTHWNGKNESVKLVYIIKNGPSTIKMTLPSSEPGQGLEEWDGHDEYWIDENPGDKNVRLEPGQEIYGNVIDRRGIKPGFPRIRFWKDGEDKDDGPTKGWATLYLNDIDDYKNGEDKYVDRWKEPVRQIVNFSFGLFVIDDVERDETSGIYKIVYKRDSSGKMTPLPTGRYRFEIWTSDVFFYEDAMRSDGSPNPNYMLPIRNRETSEYNVYKPDDTVTGYENGYLLLVENAGNKLNVSLDNNDIGDEDALDALKPHKYVSPQSNKKILVSSGDIFRLRILAAHSEMTAGRATLQWQHISSGRGTTQQNEGTPDAPNLDFYGDYLTWDTVYDQPGLVNLGTAPAGSLNGDGAGSLGAFKNPASPTDGKYYQFTAKRGVHTDFTSSSEPYALTVRVWEDGNDNDPNKFTQMTYSVWVYDEPPEVRLNRITGAYGSFSSGETSANFHGVTVNQNYYTVNGNIQVQVDRSAAIGVMTTPRQMVKWVIETQSPSATGSMLDKLTTFRANPNATTIAFFNDINPPSTADPRQAAQGWVENNNIFKANVARYDLNPTDDYVWLYVIAQDQTYNLGYTLIRLKSDNDTDKPEIKVDGLTTEGVIGNLYIGDSTPNGPEFTPDKNWTNVLGRNEAVRLNLTDDDGLLAGDIVFTLTAVRAAPAANIGPVTFTGAQVGLGGATASAELNNPLTAQNMAQRLYGTATPGYLRDGFYTLTVEVKDTATAKVGIGTAANPNNFSTDPNYQPTYASIPTTTIHFAVRNDAPEVTITAPAGSNVVNEDIRLTGTVTTPRPLVRLDMLFDPAWGTLPGASAPEKFTQGAVSPTANTYTVAYNNTTGMYTYTWTSRLVNFITGAPAGEERSFTVRAWDNLGEYNAARKDLRVDDEPPTVRLLQFNYDRSMIDNTVGSRNLQLVNGKINIAIEASDLGGDIRVTGTNTHVWWFILPSGGNTGADNTLAQNLTQAVFDASYNVTAAPYNVPNDNFTAITNGKRGRFTTAQVNASNRMRYERVIDTTKLTDERDYILLAIAEDAAMNFSVNVTPLATFTVRQSSDIPVFNEGDMEPGNNAVIGGNDAKQIKGTISDDDGFTYTGNSFPAPSNPAYVQIRFPTNAANPTTWGGWTNVGTAVYNDITERLEFTYTSTQFIANTYLNVEGDKQYQLRIYDGDTPASATWPAGKNPDGVNPGTANADNASLHRRTVILPAGAVENTSISANPNSYKFTYKNSKPGIFFRYYDPDTSSAHRTFSLPNTANWDGTTRPIFTARAGLLAALQGAAAPNRGYIVEPVLGSKSFIYGAQTWDLTTAAPDATSRHFWTIDNAWLAAFDNPNTDGMYTITIKAADTLGNFESVDWTFTKDTTGPEISFSNITAGAAAATNIVVPSGSGITITGQFTDDWSNIANTFQYRWDSRANATPAGTVVFREVPSGSGTRPPAKNGSWSVTIPGAWNDNPTNPNTGFPDGEHTITIVSVQDVINTVTALVPNAGTHNTSGPITASFIVDRQAPSMVTTADGETRANGFRVTGNGLRDAANQLINDIPLKIEQRAFSASAATAAGADTNTAKVFTLRGVVYEHNLTKLTAAIRNRNTALPNTAYDYVPELNIPPTWPGIWKVNSTTPPQHTEWYGNGTVGTVTGGDYPGINTANSTFRVRRANTTDGIGTAGLDTYYKYLWELDIRVRDFYYLMDGSMTDDTITRNVAITASDIAGNNSSQEIWNFKLDSSPPDVNPSFNNNAMLEDTSIVLQGTAKDDNNVRLLEYQIEKWNYSATPGWITPPAVPYKAYTHDSSSTINWSISEPTVFTATTTGTPPRYASDGKYRIQFNVADFSLSSTAGGNRNSGAGSREFYVDRLAPVFNWTTTLDYYQRSKNGGTITLNATAWDENGIDTSTAALRGELKDSSNALVTGAVNVTAGTQLGISVSTAVSLQVVINPGTSPTNGRYTLTLYLQDNAGHKTTDTFTFYLDNEDPNIAIEPTPNVAPGPFNAVTGRIPLRGTFSKSAGASPPKRVAVYLGANAPAHDSAGTVYTDAQLKALGWLFNDGTGNSNPILQPGGGNTNKLMEIEAGLSSFNMTIFDTRRLLDYISTTPAHIGPNLTVVASGATGNQVNHGTVQFDGVDVAVGEIVNLLTLHVLAIDEAGNYEMKSYEYYVYPEGDRPRLDAITNPDEITVEASRLLNGRIRISGTAKDNLRIKNVWFRVKRYPGDTPASGNAETVLAHVSATNPGLSIPVWDNNWNATSASQAVSSKTPFGGTAETGWFKANIGSSNRANVSWWAYINTNGEVDPLSGFNSRLIIIEAIAEDTIQNDDGTFITADTPGGLFSKLKSVTALVVSEAPRYDEETVVSSSTVRNLDSYFYNSPATVSGNTNTETPIKWGNIQRTSVRQRAAYSLVVKHNTGVGAIYWTNPPAGIPITNTDNLLSDSYRTKYDGAFTSNLSTYGITVKAEPKDPITTGTLGAGTYMIWKPWASEPAFLDTGTNKQYTIFTTSGGVSAAGAVLLKRDSEENFSWQVIVDINSAKLPYKGSTTVMYYDQSTPANSKADYYDMEFAAVDTSRSAPLSAPKKVQIPIDNLPPRGRYTYNTNVAGTAQLFGGEAGDNEGEIGAIDRVVMWFSRKTAPSASTESSISWANGTTASFTTDADAKPDGITLQAGVTMPKIDGYTGGTGNTSSIIINLHDPQGQTGHDGHTLKMGLAPTSGALGTSWYVSLDTTVLPSGRMTAHFIVYDTAGNARYYTQKLIVLNGVPKISSITLATALGTVDLNVAGTLGTGGGNINSLAVSGIISKIKTAMGGSSITDALAGIREPISVDTSAPNMYNVVYDQKDFVVRNKLLAIKINTVVPRVALKGRYYRVEYVSDFKPISGSTALTNTTGIRAGRVYMIDNPGIASPAAGQAKFPWGVLGAQGEEIRRGLVFMAVQDGSDLDLMGLTYETNANNQPSVWELNGNYYSSPNSLTRSVPAALQINDVAYTGGISEEHKTAEFAFRTDAFSGSNAANPALVANHKIRDFTANYAANGNVDNLGRPKDFDPAYGNPWDYQSLFIIRIFDGEGTALEAEADVFGDFALLSIRVNNNDQTQPFAQLYDLNPKAESSADTAGGVGSNGNRVKGGVATTTSGIGVNAVTSKSGHIEPRGGTIAQRTSLSNGEMGGSISDSLEYPSAKVESFFAVDTVSGDIIVHGYAEDNQRVGQVDLEFWNEANGTRLQTVTILTENTAAPTAAASDLLNDAVAGRVTHTEVVELNRHRVEWAYRWPSETIPSAGVGNFNIRAVAYNACLDKNVGVDGAAKTPATPAGATAVPGPNYTSARIQRSTIVTPGTATSPTARNYYDTFNAAPSGFPIGAATNSYYRYNDTRVNIRPYMVGFIRSKESTQHDIRSRQGRYVFRRGETVVVSGFNMGGTTNLYLNGTAYNTIADATAGYVDSHGIPEVNASRYRIVSVNTDTTTGDGKVEMSVGGYSMVNTPRVSTNDTAASIRPMVNNRPVVQPWNKEYNPNKPESTLWDDYIMVHIWKSDENEMGDVDRSRFVKGAYSLTYPSMSIDPVNGTLWASHQEGGRRPTWTGGNGQNIYPGGGTYISNNSSTMPYNDPDNNFGATGLRQVGSFSEHMTYTNMYVGSSGTTSRVWTITNSITKYNAANRWRFLPGMWLWGPVTNYTSNDGGNGNPRISHFPRTDGHTDTHQGFRFPTQYSGASAPTGMYAVESLWYNGSVNARTVAQPQSTEQFHNPHIVANHTGATAGHVHVSYYDSKDGSLKYRYNSIGDTGVVDSEASPRRWVNLDGGADVDDNSDATSTPGKSAAAGTTAGYIGVYDAETAFNPNTGESAASSAYAGGTAHLFNTAGDISAVYVQNGSYVTTTDNIFRVDSTDIKAPANGFIVLGGYRTIGDTVTATSTMCRIYPVNTTNTTARIYNATARAGSKFSNNAGRYNSIAVNGSGYPVIAYYDETSQQLKLAVSSSVSPQLAQNWATHTLTVAGVGTGEHVSIQINGTTFHIAAMNSITKNLVYVTGTLGTGTAAPTNVTARIIDSIGNVGEWCKLSLDSAGNPWIAYMDDNYKGSRDGVKVAFRNTTRFYKGTTGTNGNYPDEYEDINGNPITGWETMHVPTVFRVQGSELGMERFPTIRRTNATRPTGSGGLANFGAVGYYGEDYYRIAYYVD